MMSDYENILVSQEGRVKVIQLNRPKALNALNMPLMLEVLSVCQEADRDEGVGCIVIKGSEKAFAAGADIREMSDKTFEHMYGVNPFGEWDKVGHTRTPMIASVFKGRSELSTTPRKKRSHSGKRFLGSASMSTLRQ